MKPEHIRKMDRDADRVFGYAKHDVADYRESWRIFRIMAELVEGYQFLRQMQREVTVMGSARFAEKDEYYAIARELGGLLAKGNFTTITGGGPGIMEATNRGAFEAGGQSAGLNIELPFEQVLNPYVNRFTSFNYFFTRKVMLTSPANAFIFFPGGFGTLDEFLEVVDLMQLGMIHEVPIVLVGSAYWNPFLSFLRHSCAAVGSITEDIIDSWHVVDTAAQAYAFIQDVEDVAHTCSLSPNNFHCEGDIDWKVFRVMAELVEGFEFLTGLSHDITVLGTRSVKADSHYYQAAEELGRRLIQEEYAVVTGGSTGIAEAANKGAFEADGVSIGLGMRSMSGNDRDNLNTYLTKSLSFLFPFTRKLIVTAPSEGFVFFPGGFGTMHQLFEVLTLMQTKKMKRQPVVLYDREFWQPLHEYIKTELVHDVDTIADEDDELYQIVDDVEGVMKVLSGAHSAL